VPPQEVRSNAKRGLELRKKHNRGGTEVGVARARDLSNGAALPLDTIKRMNSYFSRHEVDKKGEGWGVDSPGYIAWLLWGGDAGWSWAKKIIREQENKEKSTMNDLTTAYFEITKADKNADGTLMVYGKATDDSLDIDQQICDPTWLDTAMPDWFKTGGNIREQHSNIAAGVAKEYEKKADGHYIHALVVDPISVKKVDTGVLKGFSIGIKSPRVVRDTKAANGRIIDGQIVEVSLVDRPANPNCQLVLAKSVHGESGVWKVEELIEKSDDATPDTPEIIEEVVAEETEDVTATQDLPNEEVLEKKEKKPDYEGMIQGGSRSEPADKELYNRLIGEAKKKFDVYPSAVANAWVTNEYKKRGGKYKAKPKKDKFADAVIVPKTIMSELLKFDKTQYEAARDALANLITVEAGEMKEGHNELNSISHLLQAVAHLYSWYEGEESEGEVMDEDIEMASKPEEKDLKPFKGESEKEYKARCKEAGMDDETIKSMCDKYMGAEKSAHGDMKPKKGETEKEFKARCKEAGMSDKEADDCFKTYMAAEEDTEKTHHKEDAKKTHHKSAEDETDEEKDSEVAVAESDVEAIVEKAVKSATESIRSEVALLVSAKEAALEKAATLESELATAKSLAVGGGPKRTTTPIDSTTNDLLTKALVYKAKMNAATDPTLVKGYKALHDEFMQKAEASTK